MRSSSLRRRFIAVIAITCIGALGVSLLGAGILSKRLHREMIAQNSIFARTIAVMVERVLQEPFSVLQQLTIALGIDPAWWSERIETRLRIWSYFESIRVLDQNGKIIMVVPPDPALFGNDCSQEESFRIPWQSGMPWWSAVTISHPKGSPVMTISIPSGVGVVVGVVHLDGLARYLDTMHTIMGGHVSIVDRTGSYIVHRDAVKVRQRESATRFLHARQTGGSGPGIVQYKDTENGTNLLVLAQPLSKGGWTVLVSRTEDLVNAPYSVILNLAVPFLVVFVIVVWFVLRRIFKDVLEAIAAFTSEASLLSVGAHSGGRVSVPIEEFSGLAGIFNEMQMRIHQRTGEIQESRERYRILVELLPEAVIVVRQDVFVYANPAAIRVFGAGQTGVLAGMSLDTFLPPEGLGRYSPFTAGTDGVSAPLKASVSLHRLDGSRFEAEVSSITLEYEGQLSVLAIINDISERRRIERELDAMNHRFRNAVESMEDGLWDWNLHDGSHTVSGRYCQILGFTEEEIPRAHGVLDWKALVHPDDRNMVEETVAGFMAHPEQGYRCEMRMRHRDGRWLEILSRGRVVEKDSIGRATRIMGTIMDMTPVRQAEKERRRLESQLRQEQKLSSVGTLANGVAHEINNPLMGMINYAQLLQDRLPAGEETWHLWSSEIIHEGMRIAEIVRNLLTFSRQSDVRLIPVAPGEVVGGILSLSRKLLEKDEIQTDVHFDPDLPAVCCSSAQIQQVILNLLTNARDALNERFPGYDKDKKITMHVTRVCDEEGNWVRIRVADRGCGIPSGILDRVFDPFYTSKPTGKGTGLGLSISYGIVKEHGGRLSYEKNEPDGAAFSIDLPVLADGQSCGEGTAPQPA